MPKFAANLSFLFQDLPMLERFGAIPDAELRILRRCALILRTIETPAATALLKKVEKGLP